MKRDLLALAHKSRGEKKFRTTMPTFQTDFITPSTSIKDKTINSNDKNIPMRTLSPINKETVIKNTSSEEANIDDVMNKTFSTSFSSSLYNKLIPEVGVIVKQDNQVINGGLNFHNQFGKMSVKEYEQLRAMYMNNEKKSSYAVVKDESSENISMRTIYSAKYLGKQSGNEKNEKGKGKLKGKEGTVQDSKNMENSIQKYPSQNGILNEDLFKGKQMYKLKTNKKQINKKVKK